MILFDLFNFITNSTIKKRKHLILIFRNYLFLVLRMNKNKQKRTEYTKKNTQYLK
jgi:hypothetical protein